jgi:hypothetical protein
MSPDMFDAIKEAEKERLRSRRRLRAALRALDRRGRLEDALARLRAEAEAALRRSDDALRALHAEAARLQARADIALPDDLLPEDASDTSDALLDEDASDAPPSVEKTIGRMPTTP